MSETLVVEYRTETLSLDSGETLLLTETALELLSEGIMGPPGLPGTSGAGSLQSIPFAWGDATPATLLTVSAEKRIYRVRLLIEDIFNGGGASLSVGSADDPEDLVSTTENDPTSVGTYETYPDQRYLTDTLLRLTITPGAGASTGSGQVQLEIEP